MSEFTKNMLKENGLDTDLLIQTLIKNAASEISTYYHYMLLRNNLVGFEGESLKEIVEDARIEDRNHYEALVQRIYELGGELPDCLAEFYSMASCKPAKLPKEKTDAKEIIRILKEAEECAANGYNEICKMTYQKDFRTYDLAKAILHEEIEHQNWFDEILNGKPNGHFKREGSHSPFVQKFLR